jgi:hypothetical protein
MMSALDFHHSRSNSVSSSHSNHSATAFNRLPPGAIPEDLYRPPYHHPSLMQPDPVRSLSLLSFCKSLIITRSKITHQLSRLLFVPVISVPVSPPLLILAIQTVYRPPARRRTCPCISPHTRRTIPLKSTVLAQV